MAFSMGAVGSCGSFGTRVGKEMRRRPWDDNSIRLSDAGGQWQSMGESVGISAVRKSECG